MTVYDIYQSQKGYIWLGTEAGICRYDGVKFTTYDLKNVQGKSLTNIQEDSQGNIYCMSFLGQLFKVEGDEIKQIELPRSVAKKGFRTYLIDQQDHLWLGAEQLHFKAGQDRWKTKRLSSPVRSIQQDQQGNIWILTFQDYIYRFNAKFEISQTIKAPENLLVLQVKEKSLRALSIRDNKFYHYHLGNQKWTSIRENFKGNISDQILNFQEDKQGNIWTFTSQKIACYQTRNQTFKTLIKDVFISGFLQDREGNYWFSSLGQGLFVLSNLETIHFNRSNSPLEFEQTECLEEDHLGNLYIGSNGNRLYYLNTQNDRLKASYKLSQDGVECLLFDKKRRQLYAENDLLAVFDVVTGKKFKEFNLGNSPKDLALFQGTYLISVAGDATFIKALESAKHLARFGAGKQLRRHRGRAVCVEDMYQRFWIAYTDGLYYYENGASKEVKTGKNQSIIATSLCVDHEGVVWVGTIQQGIFAIKHKKVIQHLDKSKGLISNFCKVVRHQGSLYIGTDQGLQVYNLQTRQSKFFNQQDGLPSNEIRDLLVQKDKIYLATNQGLSILKKNFNTTNYQPPLIYFIGLDVWDKAQQLQKAYRLKYNDNNLTLYFTGLAFRSGGTFRYKYRMKGLDKKWTQVESSHNFARYSALPSGQYQFEVKAINEDGVESNETATVYIDIAYPIWEKWWFILLAILFTLGIIMFVFRIRIRAIQHKAHLEQALGKAALESLKLQMNPHFLFNAMNTIQRYMMRNDAPRASNYLARFSKLMRAVLENARSEYIGLEQEIEMLENYLTLQKLQHKGIFTYRINLGKELDPEEVSIPPMFAQPFIENAIEHGIAEMEKEGMINISFDLECDFIILKITDNGIGLVKSQGQKQISLNSHSSLAIKITEERIRLYQKSLKKNIFFNITSSAQGTQVIFHLPYQNL